MLDLSWRGRRAVASSTVVAQEKISTARSSPATRPGARGPSSRRRTRFGCLAGAGLALATVGFAAAAPVYNIVDLGVIQPNDVAVQAFRISPNGNITGRNFASPFPSAGGQAYKW